MKKIIVCFIFISFSLLLVACRTRGFNQLVLSNNAAEADFSQYSLNIVIYHGEVVTFHREITVFRTTNNFLVTGSEKTLNEIPADTQYTVTDINFNTTNKNDFLFDLMLVENNFISYAIAADHSFVGLIENINFAHHFVTQWHNTFGIKNININILASRTHVQSSNVLILLNNDMQVVVTVLFTF